MSKPRPFSVSAIGAGFSGALLAVHLLRHCRPDDRVYLIEKRASSAVASLLYRKSATPAERQSRQRPDACGGGNSINSISSLRKVQEFWDAPDDTPLIGGRMGVGAASGHAGRYYL